MDEASRETTGSGPGARLGGWLLTRLAPTALAVIPGALLLVTIRATEPVFELGPLGDEIVGMPRHPSATLALGLGAAAVAGTALVNWSLRKSARVRPIAWLNSLLVLGAAFLGLFLAAVSGFARFGATTFDDERFLVAGVTYRVGHRGTWDPDDLIGREVRTDLTRTWIEVVASRNSEDMHALMFGSGEETTGASRFRSDAAGRVHVLDGPCCLVAFDPQATRPRSRAGSSRDTNLGIAPEDVSPFSLLGPDERGAASVADRLAGIIADRRACLLARRNKLSPPPGGDWAPSEAALLPALDSPNAWVRETAARFIREGGATLYPEAVRRVPK